MVGKWGGVIMRKSSNILLFIMYTTSVDVFLFNNVTVAYIQQLLFGRKIKALYIYRGFYSNITVFVLMCSFLRYHVNHFTLVVKHLLESISTAT
jgi:hypothetical protein